IRPPFSELLFQTSLLRTFLIPFPGASVVRSCVSDKIPLNPPLRKGEVVWRCLYVLSLYSASPQRAAVSNKHVAQFSHHICWGLRGKHVRVRRNLPQSPFTPGAGGLALSVCAEPEIGRAHV